MHITDEVVQTLVDGLHDREFGGHTASYIRDTHAREAIVSLLDEYGRDTETYLIRTAAEVGTFLRDRWALQQPMGRVTGWFGYQEAGEARVAVAIGEYVHQVLREYDGDTARAAESAAYPAPTAEEIDRFPNLMSSLHHWACEQTDTTNLHPGVDAQARYLMGLRIQSDQPDWDWCVSVGGSPSGASHRPWGDAGWFVSEAGKAYLGRVMVWVRERVTPRFRLGVTVQADGHQARVILPPIHEGDGLDGVLCVVEDSSVGHGGNSPMVNANRAVLEGLFGEERFRWGYPDLDGWPEGWQEDTAEPHLGEEFASTVTDYRYRLVVPTVVDDLGSVLVVPNEAIRGTDPVAYQEQITRLPNGPAVYDWLVLHGHLCVFMPSRRIPRDVYERASNPLLVVAAESAVEAESADDPVTVEGLRLMLAQTREALETERTEHREDMQSVERVFYTHARRREWCNEAEQVITDYLNPRLHVQIASHRRDAQMDPLRYRVTFEERYLVTVRRHAEVEATDEDNAYEEAESNHTGAIERMDLVRLITDGAAFVYDDESYENYTVQRLT